MSKYGVPEQIVEGFSRIDAVKETYWANLEELASPGTVAILATIPRTNFDTFFGIV